MADDLYEKDFYLWTRAQAEALRSRERARNRLDYDNLAEEIEDLGTAQRNKARSYLRNIIRHLLKLQASRTDDPRGHWRAEIREFRASLEDALTPSIRRLLETELDELHAKAAAMAQDDIADHEPGIRVDPSRRWTLEQLLGERDDPLEQLG